MDATARWRVETRSSGRFCNFRWIPDLQQVLKISERRPALSTRFATRSAMCRAMQIGSGKYERKIGRDNAVDRLVDFAHGAAVPWLLRTGSYMRHIGTWPGISTDVQPPPSRGRSLNCNRWICLQLAETQSCNRPHFEFALRRCRILSSIPSPLNAGLSKRSRIRQSRRFMARVGAVG